MEIDVKTLIASMDLQRTVRAGDLMKAIEGISEAIAEHLDALEKRLEARLAAVEARPAGVRWIGTFKHGETYTAGGLVTDRGGLWLCLAETTVRPGDSANAWKLIVKSGSHRD